jgi:ABC-type nitrate/sulfonate/bicarbonate transport system substrate-binding protein
MKLAIGIKALLFVLWLAMSGNVRAEVLKIAIPSTTQAVLAFTIARDKGYYRAEGLDVELPHECSDREPGFTKR